MLVSRRKWYLGLSILVLLFGCAESEPDPDSDKEKPAANPETVVVGQMATLNALTPTDENINQDALVFVWEFIAKPAGSTASLTEPASAHPTFVADFQGTYTFRSSVFNQNQRFSENEFSVEALPQDPTTPKSGDHIATNEICDACHTLGNWVPALVDHEQVVGQCVSCHQQPFGHIPASNACSTCHDSTSWSADRALFLHNKTLWETSNIPTYQFTYRCSCLPQGDLVITVSDGIVTEAYYADSGSMIPETDLPDMMTITRLLAVVDEALQSGATMLVTYNMQYGYPQNIVIGDTGEVTHGVIGFQVVTPPQVNQDQVQLDENKLLWQQANITDYQYTYRIGCFCPYQEDIVVVVNAGVVVEARFTPSGTPLTSVEIQANNLKTIEQLFDVVQSEIDRPAAQLTVTYNATLGYAELISVDPVALVVDEEYAISVLDFQEIVVPPENPLQASLDENRVLWQQANITDYQYTHRMGCFCPYREDIVVVVNAGVIAEAYFTPSATPLSAAEIQTYNLKTIEQLFDVVQSEIDRPAAQLTVTYNATLGYPELISVDPVALVVDEEYAISVLDFQESVVPPQNPLQTALDENRALWQQANIHNYQYTYNRNCFLCDVQEDIVVTVNGDIIIRAEFMPSGTALTFQEIAAHQLKTVDQLFNVIQAEINRPAAELIVSYNAVSGYPESITVDPSAEIFDDRITRTISDLHELVLPPSPEQAVLDANRALWQQAGLTDYQFTYQRSCLCLPLQVVTVVSGGVITEAHFLSTGEPLTPEQIASLLDIEALFNQIQGAIDLNAAVLNVTYNADYGYPETIYIDYYSQVIDEEISHSVLDFQLTN
ncbi:DUF6174 domain-containing protein [Kaarinaea lacus]